MNNGEASLQKIIGYNGCLLISDTSVHTGRFFAIVPQETAVINKVYQNTTSNSSDVHTEKTDITGKTVYASSVISAGEGNGTEYYFDSIQLTSGSVWAYYL